MKSHETTNGYLLTVTWLKFGLCFFLCLGISELTMRFLKINKIELQTVKICLRFERTLFGIKR
jgi:hypothetical protein